MALTPRDVFMGNPPSPDYRPRKQDVVQLFEETEQRATDAAVVASTEAVAPHVATAENAAQSAAQEADRSETARDAAFVNADVFPDIVTGRAAVADGEQFQVVEGNEIVRYRRDSSSTHTEVARYPSASVAGALPINRRIADFTQRRRFVAGEIGPVRLASSDTNYGLGDISVNSDGELIIANAVSFSQTQVYIDVGNRWETGVGLETGAEWITDVIPDIGTSGTGFCIVVGDLPNRVAFAWLHTGFLGVLSPTQSILSSTSLAPTYAEGDRVRLDVSIDFDGRATLTATHESGAARDHTYQVADNVRGLVAPAVRRGETDFTVSEFYARPTSVTAKDFARISESLDLTTPLIFPGKVSGPFSIANGGSLGSPTFSVSPGVLTVEGDQDGNVCRYWDVGLFWDGENEFEFEVEVVRDGVTDSDGPAISVGNRLLCWSNNGALGLFGSTGAGIDVISGITGFGAGERARLRALLKPGGTADLTGTRVSTGQTVTYTVSGLPTSGVVAPAVRRATSGEARTIRIVGGTGEESIEPRVESIEAEIPQVKARLTALEIGGGGAASAFDEPLAGVAPPEGFTFTDFGFFIFRGLQTKRFVTTFNPLLKKLTTTADFWVDPASGDDSNPGSEGSPFATVAAAFTAANAGGVAATIHLAAGEYSAGDVGTIPTVTVSHNLICDDEAPAILTLATIETGWTVDGDHPNLWRKTVTGAAPIWAYDNGVLDEYGEGRALIVRSTLSDANSNPGSVRVDENTIWVRTHDSRQPDASFRVIRNITGVNLGTTRWYWQNVHFLGGSDRGVTCGSGSGDSCFTSVRLSYAYAGNAFRCDRSRPARIFVHRSVASYSRTLDGWNYHRASGNCADIVEIDSIGHHNGLQGGSNNNGSTMHDGGRIIRVSGDYSYNQDRNVHDINNGTEVWMLGCVAGDAQSSRTDPYDNANFLFGRRGQPDATLAWLDSCISRGGSAGDFGVYGNSELRVRNTDVSPANFKVIDTDGAAVLEGY